MLVTRIMAVAVLCGAAWAQEQQVIVHKQGNALMAPGQAVELSVTGNRVAFQGETFEYVSSVMQFENKTVKGAPYSAEAVTETVQSLPDGNRISRKNNAAVYRDSQGRTRREQTIAVIGPWAADGPPPQTIFISDPVAQTSYTLEPAKKIARKMPSTFNMMVPPPNGERDVMFTMRHEVGGSGVGGSVAVISHGDSKQTKQLPAPKTESLGTRDIEGVQAQGTRTTMTIPAGEIGNERPIEIVSERWYSPELQTVVMTTRNDPRFGETTYKLTRINRTEPPASLFQLPPDYTVQEGPKVEIMRKTVEK